MPHAELWAAPTLALLRSRGIGVRAAVRPDSAATAAELVARCRDAGLSIGLWPMIDDREGRWASAWNGAGFADFTRRLLDALDAAGARPDELVMDLEPPIGRMRRALRGRLRWSPPPVDGRAALAELAALARDRGLPVVATVLPLAATGRPARAWQRILGTPVAELSPDRVNVMAYTTLLEGYSRRLLRRADAEALLWCWARAVQGEHGTAAEVSVGCAGVGALGDEAVYRSPAELSRDVAIARAAGVERIALFGLDGVLSRPPAEAWLDALLETPALDEAPPVPMRARVCLAAAGWGGRLLAAAGGA